MLTLAARAGISRKYVVDLEAGRYDPTVGVLRRIAKALGSLAELLAMKRKHLENPARLAGGGPR